MSSHLRKSRPFLLVILLFLFLVGPVASAGASEPWWSLVTNVKPSVLPRGGEGTILLTADNVGDAPATPCTAVPAGKFFEGCGGEGEPGGFESTPIVVTATLPKGLEVVKVEPEAGKPEPKVALTGGGNEGGLGALEEGRFHSTGFGTEEAYAFAHACSEPSPGVVRCAYAPPYATPVAPYVPVSFDVAVKVSAGAASGETMVEQIAGGGAPATRMTRTLPVGDAGEPVPFGVEAQGFSIVPEGEGGRVDAQAGSHPFQLTTTFSLNQNADPLTPPALAKNLTFTLPPGLVANVVAFPKCSELQFTTKTTISGGFGNACPADTAVGVIELTSDAPGFPGGVSTYPVPVFNIATKPGEPVRFGFFLAGITVTIDFHIRTGQDYGAIAEVHNVTQVANFQAQSLTIWGTPGESAHDSARGYECLAEGFYGHQACPPSSENHPVPFLTLPSSCQEPWSSSVQGESWPARRDPETEPPSAAASIPLPSSSYALTDEFERPLGLSGCDRLPFGPSIEVAPDLQQASTSTGLKVNVHVPQEVSQNAAGVAGSSVRDITVALPAGVQVNPSGANDLQACSEGLVGYTGPGSSPSFPGVSLSTFTPYLPGSIAAKNAVSAGEAPESQDALAPGINFCATASKIGTLKIKTPLLEGELEGAAYLAAQNENPFGSLIAIYLVAEDPASGVLVKLPGEVQLCQGAGEVIHGQTCGAPGQLVSTFENSPELPFEDATIEFFGGERAPLATPAHCGAYTTEATFTPWSDEPSREEAEHREPRRVHSSSTFDITSGPNGTPGGAGCPSNPLPFKPSLTGGTTNINAGGFSPLTTTIARHDGEQNLQQVVLHMPAGLEGLLSSVKLCGEPQADEGTCGPESEIGETTVSAGVGSDPVAVKGGKVYITEKYAGAPFGLSIVNPVKAGPFDLEHDTSNPAQNPPCDCVVVRAKIEVNPVTAELTITTDSSGPHAIPHLIDGIPVQIKAVNVLVNREKFTFNPTNCNPLSMTGTIAGDEGASSAVSVPFQATNCAVLKYTPTLAVSTAAKASKVNGASLHFLIAYPKGAMGTQSWMKEMKFDIPRQLPARLTTIQKACLAATFEHNRAACPPASIIGHVLVHTPVLPVPLEGPLYFVSYGGAAFPDAVAVIKGYGITIESHGKTFINGKTGVTSATFESVPDVPFESIEVTVPQGKYSEFGANLPHGKLNFCGQKLVMPILFKAQNGLEIHKNVPVGVSGCKAKTRKQKLAAALKQCRKKDSDKSRRQSCERAARRAYGAKSSRKHR